MEKGGEKYVQGGWLLRLEFAIGNDSIPSFTQDKKYHLIINYTIFKMYSIFSPTVNFCKGGYLRYAKMA